MPAQRPCPSPPIRERRGEAAGRALVAAWQASGVSQAVFARRRRVSAQRLSYWRLRLGQRERAAVITGDGFVEIAPAAPAGSSALVVEVVGGGVGVRVSRGFDPALLRAVVSALTGPVPAC